MRHLFLCTLLCILPIPVVAQPKASDLSRNPALVLEWADRVTANDPRVRATAEAALVQGAGRALPLLRRFLDRGHEDLELRTFEIIRRIGPPAIPLLVDLLRDERVSIRRNAVDALIDLAPDTVRIQPALRRAMRDEDWEVAGDAARALGALASGPALRYALWSRPSRTRILTSAFMRRKPWRPSVRRQARRPGPRQSLGRSDPRGPMGGG